MEKDAMWAITMRLPKCLTLAGCICLRWWCTLLLHLTQSDLPVHFRQMSRPRRFPRSDAEMSHRANLRFRFRLQKNTTPIKQSALCCFLFAWLFLSPARSQESPYMVTYDHYLEEPGNLEVEYFSTFG